MNKDSNPLDYLIRRCEDAMNSGHWELNKFNILNAKDELKKLRQKIADSYQELFNCNRDLVEETNKYLDYKIIGWVRINSRGDLYDPRFSLNPHLDESSLLPFYINTIEYQSKHDKLSQ